LKEEEEEKIWFDGLMNDALRLLTVFKQQQQQNEDEDDQDDKKKACARE
jgi:hypothetical protein